MGHRLERQAHRQRRKTPPSGGVLAAAGGDERELGFAPLVVHGGELKIDHGGERERSDLVRRSPCVREAFRRETLEQVDRPELLQSADTPQRQTGVGRDAQRLLERDLGRMCVVHSRCSTDHLEGFALHVGLEGRSALQRARARRSGAQSPRRLGPSRRGRRSRWPEPVSTRRRERAPRPRWRDPRPPASVRRSSTRRVRSRGGRRPSRSVTLHCRADARRGRTPGRPGRRAPRCAGVAHRSRSGARSTRPAQPGAAVPQRTPARPGRPHVWPPRAGGPRRGPVFPPRIARVAAA